MLKSDLNKRVYVGSEGIVVAENVFVNDAFLTKIEHVEQKFSRRFFKRISVPWTRKFKNRIMILTMYPAMKIWQIACE